MINWNLKRLEDILETVEIRNQVDLSGVKLAGIAIDSRKVDKDYMFIAYKGYSQDGHDYIDKAIEKGATVIMLDDESYIDDKNILYVLVNDARKLAPLTAAAFYNHPASMLKVVAVTGTNGKTTISKLLFDLFSELGYVCGLISTISIRYGDNEMPAELTTPDAISLQAILAEMKKHGVTHVFMEASSHALHQGRLDGLDVNLAIFSNITRDHLDYHKTFDNYIEAKKILFDKLGENSKALTNIDDPRGKVMVQNSLAEIFSYALKRPADFKGKIIANEVEGLQMLINQQEVFLRLIGEFNAYNALAAYGAAICLDENNTDVLIALSKLTSAEGRLDIVREKDCEFIAVVDYAHTPDALEKVLSALNELKADSGNLIAVLGCGGNRDKGKRPQMGEIASRIADRCIFTSDNPRDENPATILEDMMNGVAQEKRKNVLSLSDRKEAIKTAVMLASKDDIILVAGKGHEKYQEIRGHKTPFNDKEILRKMMRGEDI